MSNITRTGRSLQLEGLEHSPNKVTVGFKCSPKEKIQLAQEADRVSMSLSEYVESIVCDRNNTKIVNLSREEETINSKNLIQEIEALRKKVAFYEHPKLKAILTKNHGKTIPFVDTNGRSMQLPIHTIEDVYKIVIQTLNV